MHSIQHLNNQLKELVEFLTPLLPLVNSHLVQFITEDQWNSFLPPKLKDDLINLEYSKLNLIPTAELHETSSEPGTGGLALNTSLEGFLASVRSLHADKLNILTSLPKSNVVDDKKLKIFERAMSAKKAYEVSHMSQVVADVCKEKRIHWVVDIGSGIGYLSSVLLLQHKLNVFALDSSSSNIAATLKRSKAIKNVWKRFAEDMRPLTNKEKRERLRRKAALNEECKNETDVIEGKDNFVSFNAFQGRFIGLTKFVTSEEDIFNLLLSNVNRSKNQQIFNVCSNLCLAGLHTCGNLAPTSLKLYISNPSVKFLCNIGCCYNLLEEAFTTDSFYINKYTGTTDDSEGLQESLLHLDDRYHCPELDPFHRKISCSSGTGIGFPLSSHLKRIKFALGRNARSLTSKRRLSTTYQDLKPLFWRALLEMIVTDICGSWPQNVKVGKRTSKNCTHFNDYCKKNFKKIGLTFQLTDEQVGEYYKKYRYKEEELIRFYLLKASLAPLIENLINLDRLIFLHEQGFPDSHMVQIFDSVVSPRCTAIISFK